MTNNDLIPRRCRIDKLTPAEKAIYDAFVEVEKVWADIRLTEVVTLLSQARELLADFIEWKPKKELSQIESVNGWIDVDKHPTERVIIRWIYEWEEFTATWKIDDDSYLDELWQRVAFAEYVTHYMPLPPTPNKV